MNAKHSALLLAVALALPSAALACGEGMFNTGRGLPYRAYVAPRPAVVLVYASDHQDAARDDRRSVYAGLKRAGHTVTVVHDAAALRQAMRERDYDVVISAVDAVDEVLAAEAARAPAVLPVVPRAGRDAADVRRRFAQFLVDGASLGHYLRAIHRLVEPR